MSKPIFISPAGAAASPEELVRKLISSTPDPALPEIKPARYLDLAEKIVRSGINWQDEETGRIIDPYVHKETPTVTARYVGALGALMQQGRCLDLAESCQKAMEPVLSDLATVATNHGEFLVKESMMAYIALKDKIDPAIRMRWKNIYSSYDPETTYGRTRTNEPNLEARQNYLTFALAGEAIKKHFNLADNREFVYTYLEEQLARFDLLGMYRDPKAPMVYDITPRMNLGLAEYYTTYEEPYGSRLRDLLRSGAMCGLLYQSSCGEMPFGGRSNQQNFVEASFAIICELEARHWKSAGDMLMAGVFRRAAARAVNSIESYLITEPVFFNKNRFPSETQYGRQRNYGFYGAYTLLIASQLALAALVADESIPFAGTTPAESGAFVWQTTDIFHKIFASVNGSHIEIELFNYIHYDAVGWGRWHVNGIPPELTFSTPAPDHQSFISVLPAVESLAFGAGIPGEGFTADLPITDPNSCNIRDIKVTDNMVELVIDWPFAAGTVSEKITLSADSATVEAINHSGKPISYRVPMLLTNGESWGIISQREDGFEVSYKNCQFVITSDSAKMQEKWIGSSRNGLYVPGRFDSADNTIKVKLQAYRQENKQD